MNRLRINYNKCDKLQINGYIHTYFKISDKSFIDLLRDKICTGRRGEMNKEFITKNMFVIFE